MVSHPRVGSGGTPPVDLIYQAKRGSPNDLPTAIELNGHVIQPLARYVGNGDSYTAKVGAGVSIAGTGDAPTSRLGHPYSSDTAVHFNTGQGYGSALTALTTQEKFILEIVFSADTGGLANQQILGNATSGSSNGFRIFWQPAGSINMSLNTGASAFLLTNISFGFQHVMLFVDRNAGTARFVPNGVLSASLPSGTFDLNSLSNGDLVAGLDGNNTRKFGGSVSSYALWASDEDLGTAADWEALAKSRFALLQNFRDLRTGEPVACTRPSEKCVHVLGSDGAARVVQVGANWSGVGRYPGDSLDYYRCEDAGSNTVEHPTDCSQTSDWSHSGIASADKSTTEEGPINGEAPNEIIADTSTGAHRVGFDGGAGTQHHVPSGYIAAGDKTRMKFTTTSSGGEHVYYDLETGVVESQSAGMDDAGLIPLDGLLSGRKWYRWWAYYSAGAASPHDHYIQPCGESSDDYTGDGSTVDMYFGQAQHEVEPSGFPTSPMINDNTGSTRSAESNSVAVSNISGDSHCVSVDCSIDPVSSVGATQYLFELHRGSFVDHFGAYIYSTNNRLDYFERAGGVLQDQLLVNGFGLSEGGEVKAKAGDGVMSIETIAGSDDGGRTDAPLDPTELNIACSQVGTGPGTHTRIHSVRVTRK